MKIKAAETHMLVTGTWKTQLRPVFDPDVEHPSGQSPFQPLDCQHFEKAVPANQSYPHAEPEAMMPETTGYDFCPQ